MRLSAEARVGLVVLSGLLILIYMTFKIGDYRLGREPGYTVFGVFDTVAGLENQATIKMAGVDVGKVKAVELLGSRAKVTLRILPDIKLPQGTLAAVRATGLLGEKYIELIPGSGDEFLEENVTLEQSLRVADLDRLIDQFSAIAVDIKAVTASLREALGTEEGELSLKEIVANIRELSHNLNLTVKENRSNITDAIANIRDASQSVKEELPELLASLNRTSVKLEAIMTKVESGEGTLGRLIAEEGVYEKLDAALANFESITQKVEAGEGTIGKLFTDDEAYEQMTTALQGIGNVFNRIERFKTTIGFRNEYQFDEGENKGYFSLKLQPRRDKFYLLELVDDPRGQIKETITQIGTDPPVSELKTERRLKFSAEFGRRFSDVALRIGLIENTFGLGTDLLFFDDALRFSLDAWDFNSDDPLSDKVHMKVSAGFSLFKYLFVHGGYDNFMNDELDTGFVGGGIRLEDDDLKYLIGSGSLKPN